jgi:hypothetical protein
MPPIQVTPQATTSTPQGVAAVGPIAAPSAAAQPAAPAVAPAPAAVGTPNFDTAGTIAKIGDYYNIPRQTAAIAGAGQAMGQVAQQQFEAQKAQNLIKIQNQQNALDPTKYNFTKNPDGSVTILNSVGDKVDIGTYAALTGDNPAQALQKAGATDKASQQFITAYNNFQTYAQDQIAAQNGDEQAKIAVGEFQAANPGLKNMELGQLQSAFMQQYGQYFGQPQGNQNSLAQSGINSTLASQNSPMASSPYYELQAYPSLTSPNPITSNLLGSGNTSLSSLLSGLQSQQTAGG